MREEPVTPETFERMTEENGWSRELLYQLVDSVREYAIFASDLDGRVVTWNIGAEAIFGYRAKEAIGLDARLLFTPEDRAAGVPDQEMAKARDTGCAEDERWHIRKDGSRFFASGVQTAIYDDNKELTGYIKIARDLTERVRFQEELAAAYESLEIKVSERTSELSNVNEALRLEVIDRKRSEELRVGLLRKIVNTQEDERKRISREIHDHIGQQLTALLLNFNHLLTASTTLDPELAGRLREMQAVAKRLDSEVDFLAWELRPAALDHLGLAAAVANFTREWSLHFQTPAEFTQVGLNGHKLLPEVEINLYRVAQEALNNVAKHARATQASVVLEMRNGKVTLIVEDNGVGFVPKQPDPESERCMGILGMKERAELVGGTLEIESMPGQGTTIFARVPATFEQASQGVS